MNDLHDYPIIVLPGTEDDPWYGGWDWSQSLEEKFPGQDAWDFSYATSYNLDRSIFDSGITDLVMIEQGCNDEASWRWRVSLANGRTFDVVGWCDYTGWDCQSGAQIEEIE